MTPATLDPNLEQAIALLEHYSFDLSGFSATSLVYSWQQHATSEWIRDAVIEALYQGRYKAISVGQMLLMWARRGHPLRHFTIEFNRMICSPLDPRLTVGSKAADTSAAPVSPTDSVVSNRVIETDGAVENMPGSKRSVQSTGTEDSLARFKQFAAQSQPKAPVLPLTSPRSPAPAPPKPMSQAERLQEAIAAAAATDTKTIAWPLGNADASPATLCQEPPAATHQISQLLEASLPPQPQEPIRQFVPIRQGSMVYSKLKSVISSADGKTS